ncbi:7TM-DISM domain-containing protein [Pedobacter caeni]|uniref:7TM diverse intracellular signalling n=1 Tax=Pedobacter caeni TaxID=288992 RepID=A0A1M5C1M7_9SPHI|nr:7TM-DISM domain-containing protein [Pedobacter caeni]SHF48673.1 7TM diverse intracellular signalling [Pedobacter caeni]
MQVRTYGVLSDQHYSFDKILNDTTLVFRNNSSLNRTGADYYWIKTIIENPYPNQEHYRISLSVPLNYSLYSFDDLHKKWICRTSGPAVADLQRERGVISFSFKGQTKNVLYFKVDVSDIKSYRHAIAPVILLNKEISFDGREKISWLTWYICIAVLLSFSCYNLYIYFHLKEQIYLYGLVIQIGAIIFITAFKHFFNALIPFTGYNLRLNTDGSVYHYNLNSFLLHIGIILIFFGMIQLTRTYLNTKKLLPVHDGVLKYMIYVYAAYGFIPAIVTITGWYYLDHYTLMMDNILVLLIVLTIFLTSMAAYKRRIIAAKYFLLANTLPLIFGAGLACYYIINSAPTYTNNTSVLPELAILSQILTFAVALVARVRIVNEELRLKEQETIKLETDIAVTGYKRLLAEEENQQIINAIREEKNKNDLLQQRLEANERELVGNSVYIHQKNKLLSDLKLQIKDISKHYPDDKYPALKNIESSIKDSQYLDSEWEKFKLHFEQVHPDFFGNLRVKHPSLTNNELRLYAYFHINLSTKEIATLLNIEPASVRQAKARLNKKMNKFAVNMS